MAYKREDDLEYKLAEEILLVPGKECSIENLYQKGLLTGETDIWRYVQEDMEDITKLVVGHVEYILEKIKKKQIADLEQAIDEHGHQCHGCEDCESGFKEMKKEIKCLKAEL